MAARPKVKAPMKPTQLFVVVGILLALLVAASGIVAAAEGWEDKSAVSRRVFFDVPAAVQVVFYATLPLLFLWAAWQLSLRARNWQRGAPDRRRTDASPLRIRKNSCPGVPSVTSVLPAGTPTSSDALPIMVSSFLLKAENSRTWAR